MTRHASRKQLLRYKGMRFLMNLTQMEISRQLGCSRSAYALFENGFRESPGLRKKLINLYLRRTAEEPAKRRRAA